MDLHSEVKGSLGLGDGGTTRVLGTVFSAVRMALNPQQFGVIQANFPHVNEWLKAITFNRGRTGEMMSVIGPEALDRNLREIGLQDAQTKALYTLVGRRLFEASPDVAAHIQKSLPLLRP